MLPARMSAVPDPFGVLVGDFLSLARQGRTVNDPATLQLETYVTPAPRGSYSAYVSSSRISRRISTTSHTSA
ncbi:hypothetical protein SAMN04487950_2736 [Halogranum rubrum]|uniref:Uncharacterized protein n=1 Tax=Halogranum rubrum TaxID=553466 RepID=A0A1I4FE19_9EURY|nr:hypothetical protein SAMN04487950_2736 [Halogranum rubrum]